MWLSFLKFCLHVPHPLVIPAFSVNLPSHFVTVMHFSKSIIPLPTPRRLLHCLMRCEHIWSCWLLEQVPVMDSHCKELLEAWEIFKNLLKKLPPAGIRHINKSQPQLLNPDRGSQWEEEMVSFKDWPWEVLKIKFPCGFAFAYKIP